MWTCITSRLYGQVLGTHLHPDAIDTERLYLDHNVLDAVGRAGGQRYVRTRDFIDLPTLSLDDWQSARE